MDSTKNGSTEPNLKNEVSTGIFLTKLESSEEPTSVVDSNKTESNTEAVSNFNDYSCNFGKKLKFWKNTSAFKKEWVQNL